MANTVRTAANSAYGTGLTDNAPALTDTITLFVATDGFYTGLDNPVVLSGGSSGGTTKTTVAGIIESTGHSATSGAFSASGSQNFLNVLSGGSITGEATAVSLGATSASMNYLTNHGTISGSGKAVKIGNGQSTAQMFNYGTIAAFTGTAMSVAASDLYLGNHGLIEGDVNVTMAGTFDTSSIRNSGKIVGSITIDSTATVANGQHDFQNTGKFYGNYTSKNVQNSYPSDLVTNAGVFKGNIALGDGINQIENGVDSTITGYITGGAHGDALTNSGTIGGNVNLGAGSNEVFNGGRIGGSVYSTGQLVLNNSGVIAGSLDIAGTSDSEIGNVGTIGALSGGAGIEHVDTSGGKILGSVTLGTGDDVYIGGADKDNVRGDAGADMLSGGKGADLFVYVAAGDSTVAAAGRDQILDFQHLVDKVDLSAIDASTKIKGNQAFAFIGTSGFTGIAGQLHYASLANGHTLVSGDVNGDKVADFAIDLAGKLTLTSADFVL